MQQNNIIILTTWSYHEGLIQAATLPYLKMIQEFNAGTIYLYTEEKNPQGLDAELVAATNDVLAQDRIVWKPYAYTKIGTRKKLRMTRTILGLALHVATKRISTIHTFGTPAGVMGYQLARLTGCKLILDSFEPHAEYMLESGVWPRESFAYRFLLKQERLMVTHASKVVATTEGMRAHAANVYQCQTTDEFFVRPTCVDLENFRFDAKKRNEIRNMIGCGSARVGIYVGKFGGTYLSDEIFTFFKTAYDHWKGDFYLILLSPHTQEEIAGYCARSGFPVSRVFLRYVPHKEVAGYISAADFALTPVKPSPSKKFCTPIKNGEYWAIGLPVIITSGISDDSDIIERENGGAVIQELTEHGYLDALTKLDALFADIPLDKLHMRIRGLAERYRNFEIARGIYRSLYSS